MSWGEKHFNEVNSFNVNCEQRFFKWSSWNNLAPVSLSNKKVNFYTYPRLTFVKKNATENAYKSISEPLDFKIFCGGMPPDPPSGSHLWCSKLALSCTEVWLRPWFLLPTRHWSLATKTPLKPLKHLPISTLWFWSLIVNFFSHFKHRPWSCWYDCHTFAARITVYDGNFNHCQPHCTPFTSWSRSLSPITTLLHSCVLHLQWWLIS